MTVPFVGWYMPVMQLKNVVFPAPFGPMMLTILSRSTRMSMSSRA